MADRGKEKINYNANPKEWVEDIIVKGISAGASDIHIEPFQDKIKVRFRIDGILREFDAMPLDYLNQTISSLKVMANIDITESRRPQDGHISFRSTNFLTAKPTDLRLSILPSSFGEVAVIRILNRKDLLFDNFEMLGIDASDAENLKEIFQQSSGMVLVTGPSGSGKTTTLYTILNLLKLPQRNIVTLEDPVELFLGGVRQCQIHPEVGFSFATGLKSILRQDANVVMVGEIRDEETAEISIRAALCGSLFFSTMHTTNSIAAIIRLLELGIPPSLLAFSLRAIVAQRLLRNICPRCKTEEMPTKKIIERGGFADEGDLRLFKGKGCDACNGTGYQGRTGIFEVMLLDKEIRNLIIEGAPFKKIEEQAKKDGMKTLQEIAIAKVREGITTFEEMIRVAPIY